MGERWPRFFLASDLEFTARDESILFGLPAFPCKSPSKNKVGGRDPDMAERIALDVLRTLVRRVTTLYSLGATVWIISDGHVFSDCSKCIRLVDTKTDN
jgi:pyoverdine/dityrosine biosynthesis protein Dit1